MGVCARNWRSRIRAPAIDLGFVTVVVYPSVRRGHGLKGTTEARLSDRLADPLAVLLRKQGKDLCWTLQNRHPGRQWFDMESIGRPSRMITLRALRVLDWAARVGGLAR